MKLLSLIILALLLIFPFETEARVSARSVRAAGETNKTERIEMRIEDHKTVLKPEIEADLSTFYFLDNQLIFDAPTYWVERNIYQESSFMNSGTSGYRYVSRLFVPREEEGAEYARIYFEKRKLREQSAIPDPVDYYEFLVRKNAWGINSGILQSTEERVISNKKFIIQVYTTGTLQKDLHITYANYLDPVKGNEYIWYLATSNYSHLQYRELFEQVLSSIHFKQDEDYREVKAEPVTTWLKGENVFNDVSDEHPYASAIRWGKAHNVWKGYPDGSFGPDKTISRAELAKIITESLGVDVTMFHSENSFIDVNEEAWYAPYVKYAKKYGVIQGYEDGTFKPANTVNAAEAMKMIYKSFNVDVEPETGDWYEPFFSHAKGNGVLFENDLSPSSGITRKDVAWIIWKLNYERYKTDENYDQDENFRDTNWAYYESQLNLLEDINSVMNRKWYAMNEEYEKFFAENEVNLIVKYAYTRGRNKANQLLKKQEADLAWFKSLISIAKTTGVSAEDRKRAEDMITYGYRKEIGYRQYIDLISLFEITSLKKGLLSKNDYFEADFFKEKDRDFNNFLFGLENTAENRLDNPRSSGEFSEYLDNLKNIVNYYMGFYG